MVGVLAPRCHLRHARAVVGEASTGEIDVAERGQGAWALKQGDRRQLATSEESRTILIEDSHSKDTRRELAAQFTNGATRADRWDLRALSTALSLPYVAAGRVAAHVLFLSSALHSGAGSFLSPNRAEVSDIDGQPWTIRSDSIVASLNLHLHQDLLDLARAAGDLSV